MANVGEFEHLNNYYKEFLALVQNGDDLEAYGWPKAAAYATSKLFMNLHTRLWASSPKVVDKGISVMSCTPGWVRTDMT